MTDTQKEKEAQKRIVNSGQEDGAGADVGAADVASISDFASSLIGKVIADKYEIQEIRGRGGMSVVYKARHHLMKKNFAIKVLLPQLVSEQTTLMRFKNEAQAASSLDHPNVITVHDFGITPEGQPYLVMDYLEGQSLSEVVKTDGPMPMERFFEIFSQTASVLAHAHAKGVVHRDIKPSNIVVASGDAVRLVDFGIAKILSPEGQSLSLTRTGDVVGSPLYMSPEQSNGAKSDERTDIYQLGCVMYEALSGVPPFAGDNVYELIQRHANDTPQRLSKFRKSSAAVDYIEAVIFRCIAKKPEDRYQSVDELREALQRARSIAETPFSRLKSFITLSSLRRKHSSRKDKTIALVWLFACLFGGTLFVSQVVNELPHIQDKMVHFSPLPKSAEKFDLRGAQLMNEGAYKEADDQLKIAQSSANAVRNEQQMVRSIQRRLVIAQILEDKEKIASIRQQYHEANVRRGYSEDESHAQAKLASQALSVVPIQPVPGQMNQVRELIKVALAKAAELQSSGKHHGAMATLEVVEPKAKAVLGQDDPLCAEATVLRARTLLTHGLHCATYKLTEHQKLEFLSTLPAASKQLRASPLGGEAEYLFALTLLCSGKNQEAAEIATNLIARPGGEVPEVIRVKARLLRAESMYARSEYAKALPEFEEIMPSLEALAPGSLGHCVFMYAHTVRRLSPNEAGQRLTRLGRQLEPIAPGAAGAVYRVAVPAVSPQEGLELSRKAMEIGMQHASPLSSEWQADLELRSASLMRFGREREAKPLVEQMLAIRRSLAEKGTLDDGVQKVSEAETLLSYLNLVTGDSTAARKHFDRLISKFLSPPFSEMPEPAERLSAVVDKLATPAQKELLKQRLRERIDALAAVSSLSKTTQRLRALAQLQYDTGDSSSAKKTLLEVERLLRTRGNSVR